MVSFRAALLSTQPTHRTSNATMLATHLSTSTSHLLQLQPLKNPEEELRRHELSEMLILKDVPSTRSSTQVKPELSSSSSSKVNVFLSILKTCAVIIAFEGVRRNLRTFSSRTEGMSMVLLLEAILDLCFRFHWDLVGFWML